MPPTEPDSETIDAWLNGELPAEEAAVIEAYFDANPGLLRPTEEVKALLPKLADGLEAPDEEIDALVERFKTNPGMEQRWKPAETDWESVLEPKAEAGREGMLGMLGPYEVEELIATGGMGIIFKARDPKLERTIALKVLAPQLASIAQARERFLREARAAARLEHENILPIYAVHDGDIPYFSMRYVDGGTLEDKLREVRKLELEKLKSLTRQVAAALEAAHAAGFIHRDIKPANILFDKAGEKIWVCDFGIACCVEDPSLTYEGNVAGTPQYMSPEQAKGAELDGRSDLFSLGAVLFRCATGKAAFEGETTKAVLKNLDDASAPRASDIDAKLPVWFGRLLENLLAKDPCDRLPDATTVLRCIEDEHAPRPKDRRQRRLVLAGICVAALPMLVFILLQFPTIRGATNRGLVALNGDRATIDGRLGSHADLASAIASAGDGDLIYLHGDAPLSATNIEIPEGKSLTLRATPGSYPLVELAPGVSGIIARSPLTVEGIRFRDPEPTYHSRGAIAFLATRGNFVRRCQFHFHGFPINDFAARRPRALSVAHGAELTIESCYFDLVETCTVLISDHRKAQAGGTEHVPIRVSFDSSVLTGARAVTIGYYTSAAPIGLEFRNCLVATGALFHDFWNTELPPVRFVIEDCVLTPTESLVWTPREQLATLREQFSWTGRDNVYRRGGTYLHNSVKLDAGDSATLRIVSRADWVASGIPEERGSTELEFALRPEDIREKFAPSDLEKASQLLEDFRAGLLGGATIAEDE